MARPKKNSMLSTITGADADGNIPGSTYSGYADVAMDQAGNIINAVAGNDIDTLHTRRGKAIGGGIGAGLGAVIGGPAGAALGGSLGSMVGGAIGGKVDARGIDNRQTSAGQAKSFKLDLMANVDPYGQYAEGGVVAAHTPEATPKPKPKTKGGPRPKSKLKSLIPNSFGEGGVTGEVIPESLKPKDSTFVSALPSILPAGPEATQPAPVEPSFKSGRQAPHYTKRKLSPDEIFTFKDSAGIKSGTYPRKHAEGLIKAAKAVGIDPGDALALALQESGFGAKGVRDFAQVMDWSDKQSNELRQLQSQKDIDSKYLRLAIALRDKINYAKQLGYSDPAMQLQAYNGYGTLSPKNTNVTKMYGVDITNGVSMKENPLYGKRLMALKKDLLSNPYIAQSISSFEEGGMVSEQAGPLTSEGSPQQDTRMTQDQQQQPQSRIINVEHGEIMVTPEGDIIQEFDNPNRFSSHTKSQFKEPMGNFITVEDGSVIIPKKLATKFKEGDKLTRTSIMRKLVSQQIQDPTINDPIGTGTEQYGEGGYVDPRFAAHANRNTGKPAFQLPFEKKGFVNPNDVPAGSYQAAGLNQPLQTPAAGKRSAFKMPYEREGFKAPGSRYVDQAYAADVNADAGKGYIPHSYQAAGSPSYHMPYESSEFINPNDVPADYYNTSNQTSAAVDSVTDARNKGIIAPSSAEAEDYGTMNGLEPEGSNAVSPHGAKNGMNWGMVGRKVASRLPMLIQGLQASKGDPYLRPEYNTGFEDAKSYAAQMPDRINVEDQIAAANQSEASAYRAISQANTPSARAEAANIATAGAKQKGEVYAGAARTNAAMRTSKLQNLMNIEMQQGQADSAEDVRVQTERRMNAANRDNFMANIAHDNYGMVAGEQNDMEKINAINHMTKFENIDPWKVQRYSEDPEARAYIFNYISSGGRLTDAITAYEQGSNKSTTVTKVAKSATGKVTGTTQTTSVSKNPTVAGKK